MYSSNDMKCPLTCILSLGGSSSPGGSSPVNFLRFVVLRNSFIRFLPEMLRPCSSVWSSFLLPELWLPPLPPYTNSQPASGCQLALRRMPWGSTLSEGRKGAPRGEEEEAQGRSRGAAELQKRFKRWRRQGFAGSKGGASGETCYTWNNGNGLCGGLPPGEPCKAKVARLHQCCLLCCPPALPSLAEVPVGRLEGSCLPALTMACPSFHVLSMQWLAHGLVLTSTPCRGTPSPI